MKHILKFFTQLILAALITLIVYWKIPLKGLIPFPGDLLAGRFFPFNTMSWEGYPLGVPYKEFINADVIRQLYPWRELAISQLKMGKMPLWNPYSFSGTPLLANIQSAPFYPLNFLYWLFEHKVAWIAGVILQPVLAMVFMYILAKESGIGRIGASLSAISFAFSGYMVIWWQLNTVGHAALWLPLILWAIMKYIKSNKFIYILIISFAHLASILAGHPQTSIYVLISSIIFFIYKLRQKKSTQHKKLVLFFISSILFSFTISLVQIFPALQLLPLSPRGIQADQQIYLKFILPPKQLITFIAHDFFGNPGSGNYWGAEYCEFMAYFGLIPFIFAFLAIFNVKNRNAQFFLKAAIVALLFALPPLAHFWRILEVPILSNSSASRTLFIVQFFGALLSGFGMDYFIKSKRINIRPLIIIASFFMISWLIVAFGISDSDPAAIAKWKVTARNLIIPSGVFLLTSFMLSLNSRLKILGKIKLNHKTILPILFFLTIAEFSYFTNKFQTFSEPRFFFPDSPIYTFLREESEIYPYRFFGDYTASVTSNSSVPYDIYSAEGYDSLYLTRYGELLAASKTGKIPDVIPRSDANLVKNTDDFRRQRLQDLLGVRFILDKNDNPQSDWEPDPHKFKPERYQLLWQEGKYKVYENTQAFPRAFLVSNYIVLKDPQEIINKLFDPSFDLRHTLILEEEVQGYEIEETNVDSKPSLVKITSYSPNKVDLEVATQTTKILFLSDSYYPNWIVKVDSKFSKIYRANYSFRAVLIPSGIHTVKFIYQSLI